MARLDDDAVKALEVKHGPLLVIHITEGADETLAFKAATAAHWRRLNAADKRVMAGDDAAGMVPELIARELLVHPDVPILLLYVQGFVVEALLGLGLCWIALGTSSWIPGGVALGLLWALRLSTIVVFHGAVLPVFEMIAAAAAGGFAALALYKPLKPHRELLMGIAE